MKQPNFQKTKSARAIQVIETVSLAGDGTDSHPVYEIHQYWSMSGKLLAKSGSPESEQNLSNLSIGQIVKELVKRDQRALHGQRLHLPFFTGWQLWTFRFS